MGISFEAWQQIAPESLHHLHPDHPDNRHVATPKPSKYRNQITLYNGVKYHSKAEAVRAEELDWLKASGLIREWKRQPRYMLGCSENVYVADFEVIGLYGEVWTEDVKGVETAKFRRDRKLWKSYGSHPLKVLRGGKVVDIIMPEGRS